MRRFAAGSVLLAFALFVLWGGAASGSNEGSGLRAERSGSADFRDVDFGTDVTECPQAGLRGQNRAYPLRRMERDRVEQLSDGGDDIRVTQDLSCFPQDEISIAV